MLLPNFIIFLVQRGKEKNGQKTVYYKTSSSKSKSTFRTKDFLLAIYECVDIEINTAWWLSVLHGLMIVDFYAHTVQISIPLQI